VLRLNEKGGTMQHVELNEVFPTASPDILNSALTKVVFGHPALAEAGIRISYFADINRKQD